MKQFSTLVFLLSHFLSFEQTENSPDIVWQKCVSLYSQGKLDSSIVKIAFTKDPFHRIDTAKQFYTSLDTFFYKDSYYAIGQSILDPFMEFDGQQVGQWTYYYPSGKIYSKGDFSIGAYTECQAGGPSTLGYSFKNGQWKYFYESGIIMASGIYTELKNIVQTECGSDTIFVSNPTQEWKTFDTNGKAQTNRQDIIQRIINGH